MKITDHDWVKIQSEYDSGKSTYQLMVEYAELNNSAFAKARTLGLFKSRSTSEATRNAIRVGRHDPKATWTPERRKAQSEAKKKLYQEHPEKHPNRKLANNRARMSFPERMVYDYLTENNIQFEHNRKIDKYFVDFCIGSLVIEVDGAAFHNTEYDVNRDKIISDYGFTVRRFSANDVLKYGAKIVLADDSELSDIIMANHIDLREVKICIVCGSLHYTPNKTCSHDCLQKCRDEDNMSRRKVDRPDAETLRSLLSTDSLVSIGKKFGVRDNSVRKWCKAYGIDPRVNKVIADADVQVMIESGSGVSAIANHFGVTRERIKSIADRLGLSITNHASVPYSPELVSRVIGLINQGYSNSEIIPLTGLNQKQISAIRCKSVS